MGMVAATAQAAAKAPESMYLGAERPAPLEEEEDARSSSSRASSAGTDTPPAATTTAAAGAAEVAASTDAGGDDDDVCRSLLWSAMNLTCIVLLHSYVRK